MFKIVLAGRPNVGKSTLFNALTGSWDALVDGEAGLTRDRIYRRMSTAGKEWLLVDTGGILQNPDSMQEVVSAQTEIAIGEADLICLVVDAHVGLHPDDQELASKLRRSNQPLWLVVNKMDGVDERMLLAEYAPLGLDPVFLVSAKRRRGIIKLRGAMAEACPEGEEPGPADELRIAFLGRPNVGKSTLVNCLLGEERMLAAEIPGTTRDSVAVRFTFFGKNFVLVDTAGIKRRSKHGSRVEIISVLKALESMTNVDVVVLVCDVTEAPVYQDASLAARVIESGRALVVALNKCDRIDVRELREARAEFADRMKLGEGIVQCSISALHNEGIRKLLRAALRAWSSTSAKVSTSKCNQVLRSALAHQPPPRVKGKQPRLRHAHQGGSCPPRFVIHGSHLDLLPQSYRRFLMGFFRRSMFLEGTEIVLDFRTYKK